ncbi:hypothetical protein AB1Y20_020760 [Prymnesium parvum]|uniref:Fe2OG dioxygenase domain-containing protein n=1 Tax=Prymnesium parvum TaxID=97485 RepID=A0AB34JW36_PRYPA
MSVLLSLVLGLCAGAAIQPSLRRSPSSSSSLIMRGGFTKKQSGPARPQKAKKRLTPTSSPDALLRDRHMAAVRDAISSQVPGLLDSLDSRGFAVCDNFLPPDTVLEMLKEADSLRTRQKMVASQSSRWNETLGKVERYEKRNVLSTNIVGGESYFDAPRLTEYCVTLVSSIPALVNARFPDVSLCERLHTNKLAVCLGDGSYYDKHYDNSGGGDLRKLTAILYLQDNWTPARAGHLRMFLPSSTNASVDAELPYVDIEPLGGRLVLFWSDIMVHSVCESFAFSEADHRWALTVWLHTTDASLIKFDDRMEARHFPDLGASALGLEG